MKIKAKFPVAFKFLFEAARYLIAYGGRGSGKSWAIALFLVIMAVQGKCRILCTREIQRSIKDSVHKLLVDTIERLNLKDQFNITEHAITCNNGSEFIFMGLMRNVDQIKSTEGIDYCWVSEAHNVSNESWEILLPTIRKENSKILVDFNPRFDTDPTYERWVTKPPPGTISKLVNYMDNPYFPRVLEVEMEHDKKTNKNLYKQKWLGQPMGQGGKVWTKFEPEIHVKAIELDPDICNFWMAQDPHSHYYPFCVWIAVFPMNKRRNWPEDFAFHVYNEWPDHDEFGDDYHNQRKKLTYNGTLADIARHIYAKDGLGYKIKGRGIDPRYAKGSGSGGWSTDSKGIVELFAKEEHGAMTFILPQEKILDSQKAVITGYMHYNKFQPINEFNQPQFTVHPKCSNTIISLKSHRLEEQDPTKDKLIEKENEKFKDASDALRICMATITPWMDPKPSTTYSTMRKKKPF